MTAAFIESLRGLKEQVGSYRQGQFTAGFNVAYSSWRLIKFKDRYYHVNQKGQAREDPSMVISDQGFSLKQAPFVGDFSIGSICRGHYSYNGEFHVILDKFPFLIYKHLSALATIVSKASLDRIITFLILTLPSHELGILQADTNYHPYPDFGIILRDAVVKGLYDPNYRSPYALDKDKRCAMCVLFADVQRYHINKIIALFNLGFKMKREETTSYLDQVMTWIDQGALKKKADNVLVNTFCQYVDIPILPASMAKKYGRTYSAFTQPVSLRQILEEKVIKIIQDQEPTDGGKFIFSSIGSTFSLQGPLFLEVTALHSGSIIINLDGHTGQAIFPLTQLVGIRDLISEDNFYYCLSTLLHNEEHFDDSNDFTVDLQDIKLDPDFKFEYSFNPNKHDVTLTEIISLRGNHAAIKRVANALGTQAYSNGKFMHFLFDLLKRRIIDKDRVTEIIDNLLYLKMPLAIYAYDVEQLSLDLGSEKYLKGLTILE